MAGSVGGVGGPGNIPPESVSSSSSNQKQQLNKDIQDYLNNPTTSNYNRLIQEINTLDKEGYSGTDLPKLEKLVSEYHQLTEDKTQIEEALKNPNLSPQDKAKLEQELDNVNSLLENIGEQIQEMA